MSPPPGYRKKMVRPGQDHPLVATYSEVQVSKGIAFYGELNRKREGLKREDGFIEKCFELYGWDDTTTIRVYMRETVARIATELFYSNYSLAVRNVNRRLEGGVVDREHGFVAVSVRATEPELEALLEYIRPGSSYYVYDGEESKYVPGDTASSEFIIVKVDDALQPERFWRRSQSFISRIEVVEEKRYG
jgi:hypothetical protein